jgi:hypothetical protein
MTKQKKRKVLAAGAFVLGVLGMAAGVRAWTPLGLSPWVCVACCALVCCAFLSPEPGTTRVAVTSDALGMTRTIHCGTHTTTTHMAWTDVVRVEGQARRSWLSDEWWDDHGLSRDLVFVPSAGRPWRVSEWSYFGHPLQKNLPRALPLQETALHWWLHAPEPCAVVLWLRTEPPLHASV